MEETFCKINSDMFKEKNILKKLNALQDLNP